MHYSMTGFGSGIANSNTFTVQIELRSLNNRHLDIRTKIPRNLFFWEPQLREKISKSIRRGVIDVVANVQFFGDSLEKNIKVDLAAAYAKIAAKIWLSRY